MLMPLPCTDVCRWLAANMDRFGSLARVTLADLGILGKVCAGVRLVADHHG
jgi:hypothetical protein